MRTCNICRNAYAKEITICPFCGRYTMENNGRLPDGFIVYGENGRVGEDIPIPHGKKKPRGFYPNFPTALALGLGIPSVFFGFFFLYFTSAFAVIAGIVGLFAAVRHRDGSIFLSLVSILIGLLPIAVWLMALAQANDMLARILLSA